MKLARLGQKVFLQPLFNFIGKILHKLWNYFKKIFLNRYIRCGISVLQTVWPLVIILSINYLFLNLMDQSQDLLDSLSRNLVYSIFAFTCLLLYGLIVWYTTRIVLLLKDQRALIDEKNNKTPKIQYEIFDPIDELTLRAFTKWTPVTLGLIPFISLLTAFSKVENVGLHELFLVLLTLLYIGIAYQVRNYIDGPQSDEETIDRNYYEQLLPSHKRAILSGFIGGIILLILATVWQTNLFLSSTLGPLSVVFLALALWTMIAGWFTYIDYRYRAPFTIVCVVLMITFNNNNHQIRTISNDPDIGTYSEYSLNRQTIPEHFKIWLDSLKTYRDKNGYTTNPTPVYLIATEGGGIRSAYWTAAVLRQLNIANKDFFRHVYAISGVSGGSVGAAFYTARYKDCLQNPNLQIDIDAFFKHDHLSPLLTAMLIPDMLQKFSPVGINSLDRAQYLEDSWSKVYYSNEVQRWPDANTEPLKTLDKPFIHLWDNNKGKYRYQVPILFLNSTQAETGRKGILTPLLIKNDSNFTNVIDIQHMVYRHIPLKTAASMSARFPIVTPPATVRVVNEPYRDAANFVDGGYIDNSGTTTLLSVLSSLTMNPIYINELNNNKIIFKIIILKNSADTDPNDSIKPIGGLYELKAPLNAFFESWDNSGGYRRYAVQEYLRRFSAFEPIKKDSSLAKPEKHRLIDPLMYTFDLDRKTAIIPLGWELSEQAETNIREQAVLQMPILNKKYLSLFNGLHKKKLINKYF